MNSIERHAIINAGPWILFDGTCNLCRKGASHVGFIASRRGFRLTPLQSSIGLEFRTPADEMQVITREGAVIGGLEAFAYICRHIWWAAPVGLVLSFRPVLWMLGPLYRLVARNRYRASGTCPLKSMPEENPYALEL